MTIIVIGKTLPDGPKKCLEMEIRTVVGSSAPLAILMQKYSESPSGLRSGITGEPMV